MLTDRQREILATAERFEFDGTALDRHLLKQRMTRTRFQQLLGIIVTDPHALQISPQFVYRVRERLAARQRARDARLLPRDA